MRTIIVKYDEVFKFSCTRGMFKDFEDIQLFLNTCRPKNVQYFGENISFQIDDIEVKLYDYKKIFQDDSLLSLKGRLKDSIYKRRDEKNKDKHFFDYIKKFNKGMKRRMASLFLAGALSVTSLLNVDIAETKYYEDDVTLEDMLESNIDITTLGLLEDVKLGEITVPSRGAARPKAVEKPNLYNMIKEQYPQLVSLSNDFNVGFEDTIDYINKNNVDINNMSQVMDAFYQMSKSSEILTYEISQKEIEMKILEYADLMGISSSEEIATIIAIFRHESGFGTSYLAETKNNYGGHLYAGKGITYATPNVGIYRLISVFYYNLSLQQNYNPNMSIEANINATYCTDGSDWSGAIASLKSDVFEEYRAYFDKEKQYVKIAYKTN